MQIDNTISLEFYFVFDSHVLGRGGTSTYHNAADSVTVLRTTTVCQQITVSMATAPQKMHQTDAMSFCSA